MACRSLSIRLFTEVVDTGFSLAVVHCSEALPPVVHEQVNVTSSTGNGFSRLFDARVNALVGTLKVDMVAALVIVPVIVCPCTTRGVIAWLGQNAVFTFPAVLF